MSSWLVTGLTDLNKNNSSRRKFFIFIFCHKYCLFTQPIACMVIGLLCYVRKNMLKSSSFVSVKWQKSEGNVMNPVTLPFPMCNNCFENTIAVWSCCKNTRMLVVNWSVFTYRLKYDEIRHVFSSSTSGNNWKSLTKMTWENPPKMFWLSKDLSKIGRASCRERV